ncbi:MAG TPA: YqeG family HAD IIIA-type phosphatase [Candidatus Atribacteria bacterium]|nr:YqeG family HAD IIIA-type phosphatase [Candidatus Atribacteria bacterium]
MKQFLRKFYPSLYVDEISEIPLDLLKKKGIQGLIIDLDNTIAPWDQPTVTQLAEKWLKQAKNEGFKIFLVSNSTTSRVNYFMESLKIPGISMAQKPRRGSFRKALESMDLNQNQVTVIGDQIFTDVLGGNRLNLHTILVNPINRKEFFFTRLVRLAEKFVMKRFLQWFNKTE